MRRIALLASLALSLVSCPLVEDPWEPIYRDSSHNYLLDGGNAFGFNNFEPADPASPGWRRAYGEDASNTHLSFTYTGSSTGAGDGPPAGSPIYRLQTNNLLQDGDLEGVTIGMSPSFFSSWPTIGFSGSFIVQDGPLNNYCMNVNIMNKSFIFLSTALPSDAYSLLATTDSNASFEIRNENPLDTSLDPNTITPSPSFLHDHLTGTRKELFHSFSTDDDSRPMIGSSSSTTTVSFDDFRIVSASLKLGLALELAIADTAPALFQGWFRFSVWIKKDDQARYPWEATPDSASAQRPLASRAVAIGIGKNEGSTSPTVIELSTPTGWDAWTLIQVEKQLSFDQSDVGTVLRLELWPISPYERDAASILVAAPSLTFHLNGL